MTQVARANIESRWAIGIRLHGTVVQTFSWWRLSILQPRSFGDELGSVNHAALISPLTARCSADSAKLCSEYVKQSMTNIPRTAQSCIYQVSVLRQALKESKCSCNFWPSVLSKEMQKKCMAAQVSRTQDDDTHSPYGIRGYSK